MGFWDKLVIWDEGELIMIRFLVGVVGWGVVVFIEIGDIGGWRVLVWDWGVMILILNMLNMRYLWDM